MPESASAESDGLFLDDGLGRTGCRCAPECRAVISIFRAQATRYRLGTPLYVGMTPGELAMWPPQKRAAGIGAIATLDLDAYPNAEALLHAAETTTSKRRQVNRLIERAKREGYYVKPFPFALHVPDIVDVHHSKAIRNGRPIGGGYYLNDVAGMGGAPTASIALAPPACPQHHWQYWGVFRHEDGHRQGEVTTDERLVGYIALRRQGDSAWYDKIMGHGDHMASGVMYLLHYEMASRLLADRPAGLRYLVYHQYSTGGDHALRQWKDRALFKPRFLFYVQDRRLAVPADPPMPGFAEGLLALKQTLGMPASAAAGYAQDLGVSPAWLRTLHYAWTTDQARGSATAMDLLRAAPAPTLDVLRPLASDMFPVEAIDGIDGATVILHGDERGLDTLLPLADAGLKAVAVYHGNPQELAQLQETYPADWSFHRLADEAKVPLGDLVVLDPPLTDAMAYLSTRAKDVLARFTGKLLVTINRDVLRAFGCEGTQGPVLAGHLSALCGRDLVWRQTLFRSGEPQDAYWIWLEPISNS